MPRNDPQKLRPNQRVKILLRARNLKMARSAHAYVRGSTEKFYEWLEKGGTNVPVGPSVWICGDCHLGNLGPLADSDGYINVQIRDLDQTVIGNPAHDLIRLGLSLASAARGSDLPGVTTARMLEELVNGYKQAIRKKFDGGREKDLRPERIRSILKRAVRRRWRHLAEERIEDVKPSIPLGKRFWALTSGERSGLNKLFQNDDVRGFIASLKSSRDRDQIEVLDAAYWVKGCSSLGRPRYAVLIGVGEGKKTPHNMCLIDLKESVRARAPRAGHSKMPRDNAERVVTGERGRFRRTLENG